MITFKNNFGTLKKEFIETFDDEEWTGFTVAEIIPDEYHKSDIVVQVTYNGKELDDDSLRSTIICPGAIISCRVIPKAELTVAAVVIWLAKTIVVAAIGIGIGYGIQAIINAISGKPRKRKEIELSPTYDFDSTQNTTKNGTPINLVYGEVRIGGQVLQAKTTSISEGKNAFDILVGISEGGEGGIESICGFTTDQDGVTGASLPTSLQINDNPGTNFKDIYLYTRLGTSHQAIISNFEDTVTQTSIYSTVITNSGGGQVFTAITKCDSIRVTLTWETGLYSLSNKGVLHEKTIQYRIRARPVGSGSWFYDVSQNISRANRESFSVVHLITGLSMTLFEVEVTRNAADDSVISEVSTFKVTEVSEIINDDLAYPNKALAAVRAIATDQLHGSQPNVSFLVRGLKVRVYSSISSYTLAWTRNPSWIILDLLTNAHHGLGSLIPIASAVDIQSFIDYAAYCNESVPDGKGGVEARCEVDIVVDSTRDSWEWIQDIAQASFGVLFYTNGKFYIRPEKVASPVMLFTPGMYTNARIGYTNLKDRANYIELKYPDRDYDFNDEVAVELDETITDVNLYVKETIDVLPVTRRSQIHRIGKYRISVAKNLIRYISFTTSIQAIRCEPNDVIEVGDDNIGWGTYSGLAVSGTSGAVTLDQEVTLSGGTTYYIRVWHQDGTFEEKQISSPAGTYTTIGIIGTWSTVPVKYRPFSIGVANYVVRQFRVVDFKLKPEMEIEIFAIEYNSAVYTDSIITLPTVSTNTGFLPLQAPPDVTNLTVVDRLVVNEDGTIQVVIDAAWVPPKSAIYAYAEVWTKLSASSTWPTSPAFTEARGSYARVVGNYQVGDSIRLAVTSNSVYGVRKHPDNAPYVDLVISLDSTQPDNVTGFTVIRLSSTLYFSWNAVSNADLAGYEIRQGPSWNTGQVLVKDLLANKFETDVFFAPKTATSINYMIRAKNKVGNYSASTTSLSITVDPRIDQNLVEEKDYRTSDWPGTLTNLARASGAGSQLDSTAGVSSASYETSEHDLGGSYKVQVAAYTQITQIDSGLDWAAATFTWESATAQARTWEGLTSQNFVTTNLQWRYGDSSGSLGSYVDFFPSERKFRYAQYKLNMTITSTDFRGTIEQFKVIYDVPDVISSGKKDVTGNSTISYNEGQASKAYTKADSIIRQVLVTDLGAGEYFTVEPTSGGVYNTTDFKVRIKDSGGTELGSARKVEWLARGY